MAAKNYFKKLEAIDFGYTVAKENLAFFAGLLVVLIFIYSIPNILESVFSKQAVPSIIISILFFILNLIISMGLIKISLKFVDKEKAGLSNLFYTKSILPFFLTTLLSGVITLIGFILLIVPGIIIGTRLQFAPYLVIDKGLGPIEALKKSWKMTEGVTWNLILLGLLSVWVNIAGILVFVIGLVITVPATTIAKAYVYRKLSS